MPETKYISLKNLEVYKEESDKALEGKVDKVEGRELSSNDFSDHYKETLDKMTVILRKDETGIYAEEIENA